MFLDNVSNEPNWYLVHTYTGYENSVAEAVLDLPKSRPEFEGKILDVQVPEIEEVEIKNGKEHASRKKMFPGWVIVKMCMEDTSWFAVRNIRGVTGFAGPTPQSPTPLQENEIAQLGIDASVTPTTDYEVGDRVCIISGPLENFDGIVESFIAEKKQVRVKVSMFGREIMAELEYNQIQKQY